MSALPLMLLFLSAVALTFQSCKGKSKSNNLSAATDSLSDDALMDTVQRRTFLYFWEGAEPNSGLAPERYHVDGVYPENDANVVTSGGSGFGIAFGSRSPLSDARRPGIEVGESHHFKSC